MKNVIIVEIVVAKDESFKITMGDRIFKVKPGYDLKSKILEMIDFMGAPMKEKFYIINFFEGGELNVVVVGPLQSQI